MKFLIVVFTLFLSLFLSGCSTLDKALSNRLTCTVAGDQSFVVSQYGPFGLSAKIDPADGAIVCASKPLDKPGLKV